MPRIFTFTFRWTRVWPAFFLQSDQHSQSKDNYRDQNNCCHMLTASFFCRVRPGWVQSYLSLWSPCISSCWYGVLVWESLRGLQKCLNHWGNLRKILLKFLASRRCSVLDTATFSFVDVSQSYHCWSIFSMPTLINLELFIYIMQLASYPGPAQLSVTCSTEKWGEPGIFSHGRWHNRKVMKICRTNRVHFAYYSTDYTLNAWYVWQSPPTS